MNPLKSIRAALAPLAAFALVGAGLGFSGAARAADVGVSVQINQPGVFGRIDIGRFPQPEVVVAQPVIIGRPVVRDVAPVYMWVPPAHRRDWRHHCAEYRACGVPVYFVRDEWYGRHVRGHERENFGGRGPEWRGDRHDDHRDDHREERHDERQDRRHDDRRGDGRGEGHR
jgi:hypothetical protein